MWKVTFVESDNRSSRIEFVRAQSASEASKLAIDQFGWGTSRFIDVVRKP
jgi:hypothetical protein